MEKPTIDLIFQVALCVDDLESVVEQWKELFDLDTATIVRKCTKDAYESDGWDGLNYNGSTLSVLPQILPIQPRRSGYRDHRASGQGAGEPVFRFSDSARQRDPSHRRKVGGQKFLMRRCRNGASRAITTRRWGPVLADGTRKSCTFYDLRRQLGVILECGSVVVGPLASDPRAGNPEDFVSD